MLPPSSLLIWALAISPTLLTPSLATDDDDNNNNNNNNGVTFDFSSPSEVLMTTGPTGASRIRGARSRGLGKDFVLGGLFPIHASAEGGGACGELRLERGLERMEAMLFAIDKINSDPSLLPNLTLGYDIRDTCSSENIGLDETVDLIITSSQLDIQSCLSAVTVEMETDAMAMDGGSGGANDNGTTSPTMTTMVVNETFFMDAPTSGIVGAASSRVSVPVASLARLFAMPQVSYASSSAILSNRDRYTFFHRTIPPDDLQARAMIDVMLHFRWSYVSTIYSLNPYGEPGINEFHELAAANDICIDVDVGIRDDYSEAEFAALALRLVEVSEASVVILFTSQDNAMQLLAKVDALDSPRRFVWIASDAWARSINVVHMFNETAAGLFGFAPLTNHLNSFQGYFEKLTVESNRRNPWFQEFYAAIANCSVVEGESEGGGGGEEDGGAGGGGGGSESSDERPPCRTNSSVTEIPRYAQGNFIPLVVDAVYTYAHALQNYLDANCGKPLRWFPGNRTCYGQLPGRPLDGRTLLEYVQGVDFTSITGNRVLFDAQGNVEGRYEILNYQATTTTTTTTTRAAEGGREYSFRRVAVWDSSVANDTQQQALMIESDTVFQFGVVKSSPSSSSSSSSSSPSAVSNSSSSGIIFTQPESQCGQCREGQVRRVLQSACCGLCEPCLGQRFSNNTRDTRCHTCPDESWGDAPLNGSSGCVPIRESFLKPSHPYSIIIMIIAIMGVVGVVFTAAIFAVFWRTPVVKSSGREQMVILLIGITTSFVSAFFFVAPPTPGVCGLQRWTLWTGFVVMYGALLVKIVRVARIFLWKNTSRPRFTEPVYQVIFTLLLILLQWVILAISFGVQPPEVGRERRLDADEQDAFPEIVVTCVSDHVGLLGLSIAYETMLIIACTILGALSFSYPENFNEAKYVAFCALSTLVIWIAFIITYIATRSVQEFQNIAISLAIVMTAYAVLLCLFGPKLIIVLFQPKKNVAKFSQRMTTDLNSAPPPLGLGSGGVGSFGDHRLSVAPSFVMGQRSATATPMMERKEKAGGYVPPTIATSSQHSSSDNQNGLMQNGSQPTTPHSAPPSSPPAAVAVASSPSNSTLPVEGGKATTPPALPDTEISTKC